jgi:hypothetical protein
MTYSASSDQKKNEKQINRSWLSMSRCCPLFICVSFFFWSEPAEYVMVLSTVYMFVFFFWSELAEYVMVLSTVYLFVIFLLAGAG